MLTCVFMMMMALEPIRTIKLDTGGALLNGLNHNTGFLEEDDTFIIRTKYHVWHFRMDGSLINRFGGKGEGPGEFEIVGAVKWDGTHYWAIDGLRLLSQVFDNKGSYLSTNNLYFRELVRAGRGQIFAVDYSMGLTNYKVYAPTLQEVSFSVDDGELFVEKKDPIFFKVTPRQMSMAMNFKLVWMVKEGNSYLIVNQVEPRMYVYDEATRREEARVDLYEPFEAPYVTLKAGNWIEPPKSLRDVPRNRLTDKTWWTSWSRINYFGKLTENEFVLAYVTPDAESPQSSLQEVIRLNRDGRPLSRPMVVDGYCIGTRGSRIYMLREGDSDDVFEYFIDVYDLSSS